MHSLNYLKASTTITTKTGLLQRLQHRVPTNDFERAKTNLRRAQMRINSLLRFDNSVRISLTLPNDLPELKLDAGACLELALKNNPEVFDREAQRINTARSVERAKKNSSMWGGSRRSRYDCKGGA